MICLKVCLSVGCRLFYLNGRIRLLSSSTFLTAISTCDELLSSDHTNRKSTEFPPNGSSSVLSFRFSFDPKIVERVWFEEPARNRIAASSAEFEEESGFRDQEEVPSTSYLFRM